MCRTWIQGIGVWVSGERKDREDCVIVIVIGCICAYACMHGELGVGNRKWQIYVLIPFGFRRGGGGGISILLRDARECL